METEYTTVDADDADVDVGYTVRRRGFTERTGSGPPRVVTDDAEVSVTWEEVALAIGHRIGIPMEEAERDAAFIMDIFGFEDRVIDNVLERPDRQLFYILEEEGMLTTDREENALWDGREWRTHYWQLRKGAIKRIAEEGRQVKQRRNFDHAQAVYDNLPSEAWVGGRI